MKRKVRSDLTPLEQYGGVTFVSSMDEFKGCVYGVTFAPTVWYGGVPVCSIGSWLFSEEMFEPIVEHEAEVK